jgi:hypothetical protein
MPRRNDERARTVHRVVISPLSVVETLKNPKAMAVGTDMVVTPSRPKRNAKVRNMVR